MNSDTRIYVSSISAVTAIFFLGVGIPCGLAFGWPAGVGLGAMCAFWGGPGFGVMVAGARRELHHESQTRSRVTMATTVESAAPRVAAMAA